MALVRHLKLRLAFVLSLTLGSALLTSCSIVDFDFGGGDDRATALPPSPPGSGSGGGGGSGGNDGDSDGLPGPPPAQTEAIDALLFTALNRFRSEQGAAPLRRSPLLERAAQDLANVMARKDQLSHSADGQRAGDRIRAAGYITCTQGQPWGENIALSSVFGSSADLADSLTTGWANSPGHRRNMLGRYAEAGIAVALRRDGRRIYAVQVFATPGPGPCL